MSNGAEEDARQWYETSLYDIETAEVLLESQRYLYVPYLCQQSLEKRLKGVIVERSGQMPPKTHDLVRLVRQTGLAVASSRLELLSALNTYYIESRYPPEASILSARADKDFAEEILRQTQELLAWLDHQKR